MKKGIIFILILSMLSVNALAAAAVDIKAQSAVLMENSTGNVLLEQNPNQRLPIASVTKVMTMLLIMEAIQNGKITMNDMVPASEYACSMGGSQVYLEPGEKMSVSDLIKAIAVASGNDASVAMAEYVMGSAPAFVEAMNARAKALGMKDTNFVNCNGLDDPNHYSSAYDVALMSKELLTHKDIYPFLGIWMDSLRGGKFALANTNRLIRFYQGAIGTKTGSTSEAKYCLSAAAKRNNMQLIAVVLGAPTTNDRFGTATKLLDWGFANYAIAQGITKGEEIASVPVKKGVEKMVSVVASDDLSALVPKGANGEIKRNLNLPESINAPIEENEKVGSIDLILNNNSIGSVALIAKTKVQKENIFNVFFDLIKTWANVK